MRVLVVEDDDRIGGFLVKGLEEEGYAVDRSRDGEDGLHLALTEPYDVAVVDIMLPRMDGLSMIEALRQAGKLTPVLILSAKRSVDERVQGLQAGGDDYLTKPFAFSELSARIQALLRRSSGQSEATTIRCADLVLDLIQRKATRGEDTIEIQPREFALLEYLMRNKGRVVTRTMILEHVWNYRFDPQTNVVDARICRLRDKIDRPYSKKLIKTIRGAGYVLTEKT